MKLRIYLDTSVLSAYYDDRAPERQGQTKALWARLRQFEVATSELVRQEIEQTPDPSRRQEILGLLDAMIFHSVTEDMRDLAQRYVNAGVFSPVAFNDALHVAIAVLTRQDVLISWNFKHLVNRVRRAKVNLVNASSGLPTLEIVAPPEI